MRGTVCRGFPFPFIYRITPAHAGNSRAFNHNPASIEDHPRPCGEQSWSLPYPIVHMGSPPPMRGTAFFSSCSMRYARITPAHAGNSTPLRLPVRLLRDHPRPCGEQCLSAGLRKVLPGSPPPMRGTGMSPPMYTMLQRITPAHAGNSELEIRWYKDTEDHPRPCGEQ